MNFEELESQVENEKIPKKEKKHVKREASANEKRLFELEQEIESELKKSNPSRKGCFGMLVRFIESPVCKKCFDAQACEKHAIENGHHQVAIAELEIENIVIENEIKAELSSVMPEASDIPELNAIYSNARNAQACKVDVSFLGKECAYQQILDAIIKEKPKSWKRVNEICVEVSGGDSEIGSKASKKIMKHLSEKNIIRWDSLKKEIIYTEGF